MQVNRREFIKTAAMGAAVAAATGTYRPTDALADGAPEIGGSFTAKAPCRFCGTGCHALVTVEKGRVTAIEGDPKAPVNQGELCVKGYNLGGILYGKDRLTKPLLRKNGTLVEIEWDEAIAVIAKRVMMDPKGFAVYGSGQWTIPEGYLNNKFVKGALANNQIEPNARLCMASAVTGFLGTYGVDEPANTYDDLDQCDTVILWGNNPAEQHPMIFARVLKRKDNDEKLKVIDLATRRTRSTQSTEAEYMGMNPHGDLAIALGIAHQLVMGGHYDKDFVAKHCNFRHDGGEPNLWGKAMSFVEYKKALAPYTPEHTAKLSGLTVAQIKSLGALFADKKQKIVSLWCMGMNQHTRGHAINTLVHAIHLLSGHFGKTGDGPMSLTGQPSACGTVREVGTLAHALPGGRVVMAGPHRAHCEKEWDLPAGRIKGTPGYHTVKMWEQFMKPAKDGGDIHTIWVQVTNPAQSLPNVKHLVERKPADKFMIVSDVYPTVTTALADLVLPSALWVEKNGVFGNSERRTQQWFKMVEPPGEARDDVWQVLAVAHKLFELGWDGVKTRSGKFLFALREGGKELEAWKWEVFNKTNVDRLLYEEYRPFTHMKRKNVAPYDVLVKKRGMRWPVTQQGGRWVETKLRFVEGDDPFVAKGKGIQFYCSKTKDDKAQIWFHPYVAPPEVPDKDYPLWLCTGRVLEQWHTGTMTNRVPDLNEAMPRTYVEINESDAEALGVDDGDDVVLETRRGKLTLEAKVGGRGQPNKGNVFVPFFDQTLLINRLTLHAHCPVSKQPDYKKCAARITAAD